MGLLTTSGSNGRRAASVNIAAIQSITTGTLILRVRFKLDGMINSTGSFSGSFCNIDDGTDVNAKMAFWWTDVSSTTTKRLSFKVPGQGGQNTQAPAVGGGWGLGRYGVLVMGMNGSNAHTALYDDTGTGTLIDGLAPGSSAWYQDVFDNLTPYPNPAGNGQVSVGYDSQSGNHYATTFDSLMILNALPTLDQQPVPGSSSILAAWDFDDAIGASTYASYKTSGGVVLTPVTGCTLSGGGVEAAYTQTPTTVTGTPTSPAVTVGSTVTLVPQTLDAYGVAMLSRTYSYSDGTPAHATTSSAGVCTGVAAGTDVVTVTDTAGGSPTPWTPTVTVSAAANIDTWTSNNPAVATVGTGSATETITAVAAGVATITVTRTGTGISCLVNVVFGGASGSNEPSGMTVGMNTGDMTNAPATVANGTWTAGTSPVTTFSIFGPGTVTPGTHDPSKIQLCPDGPGIEEIYDANLQGGNNYCGWGASLVQPIGTNQGVLYGDFLVRTRNWSNLSVLRGSSPVTNGPRIIGVKLMEPRCGQNGENHVISQWGADDNTQGWLYCLFQSPTANVPSDNPYIYTAPVFSLGTNYTAGQTVTNTGGGQYYECRITNNNQPLTNAAYWYNFPQLYSGLTPNGVLNTNQSVNWRRVNILMGQETTPGTSGDAYLKFWVGAKGSAPTLAFDSTAAQPGPTWPTYSLPGGTYPATFNMLNAASTKGWQGINFNQTYGGLQPQYSPPNTMYLGLNQMYFSTK